MNAKTEAAIRKHGETLIRVFGLDAGTDPVKLCKALRRWETKGAAFGLRLCNGPEFKDEKTENGIEQAILVGVDNLLHFTASGVPVFLNRDPRGYALKIKDEWTRAYNDRAWKETPERARVIAIPTDWGGYGLIAPDLTA